MAPESTLGCRVLRYGTLDALASLRAGVWSDHLPDWAVWRSSRLEESDVRRILSVLLATLAVVAACSDDVSPADRALDGPWTTGHTVWGLELGLDLTWTSDRVAGSGSYNALATNVHCGATALSGLDSLGFSATRPSSTEISGTMRFASSITMAYEGSLNGNTIGGALIAADGTRCPLTLHQGLIP